MVMGHEFCCEVVELGPGCSNLQVGDVVVACPSRSTPKGLHALGYSNRYNGGYAELMVFNEMTGIKVPERAAGRAWRRSPSRWPSACMPSRRAASQAATRPSCSALGPVGLACIAELRMRGIGPIVAADFSPKRRAAGRAAGCRRGGRPTRDAGHRGVAQDRRHAPARDLRSGRRARHDRAGDAHGAEGRAHPGGRRVHAGGPHPPDARHRPRAEHPVRARLRPDRVRRCAARPSPTARSTFAPGSPAPSASTVCRRRSPTSANPERHAKILVVPGA